MPDVTETASDPAGEVVDICRRPDPDGHLQLRRGGRAGGAAGGGVRRGPARRGRHPRRRMHEREPGRTSLVARWGSGRRGAAAPARPPRRRTRRCGGLAGAPVLGRGADGYVWGRGAVDMKDFDAMLLSVVRARVRTGRIPDPPDRAVPSPPTRRPVATTGAQAMVEDLADELADCTEAVGEVGGFSTTVRGQRVYLIEAAEKGMAWMRLTARGRAGHGSMINHDNAVTELASAVARIGAYEWPVRLTPDDGGAARVGRPRPRRHRRPTPENAEALIEEFGDAARMLGAVIRNTANPTHARRRLQGQRHPDRGHRPRRRPVPARLRGRVLRHPRRALRREHLDRLPLQPASPGRRRTTATWSAR